MICEGVYFAMLEFRGNMVERVVELKDLCDILT